MNHIKKISRAIRKYMAVIVLLVAVAALLVQDVGSWIRTGWINYLLMLVMFGMGLTLKLSDFAVVFRYPRDVAVGCASQFLIMPLLALGLGKVFGLDTALLAGVVLVGTCPGGTSSNVITYLSGGDVAFSVGMTSVNTLLAPVLTPAITYLLLRTSVTVNVMDMFLSIIKVVLLPISLGFLVNRFWGKYTKQLAELFPTVSILAICMIVASVVSANSSRIVEAGGIVFIIVILHNLLGYICGYGIAKLFRMNSSRQKAMSIEIGMQNSGLAVSLAAGAFPNLAMAAVPGAIFSVWHNISGAMIASIFAKQTEKKKSSGTDI